MSWVTWAALYFIAWWITLFAILPIGLRTQDEDDNVTPGTTASAPRGPHILRAMLWTTLVSALICVAGYFVVDVMELGLDDIPRIIPQTGGNS